MANLIDTFSDAATEEQSQSGKQPVAPEFNKAATEDRMTAEAATATETAEPILFQTAREISVNDKLADDAFAAVKRGDVERVREMLASGLEINIRDDKGFSLLMHAVQEKQTEVGKELLFHKIDPQMRNDA